MPHPKGTDRNSTEIGEEDPRPLGPRLDKEKLIKYCHLILQFNPDALSFGTRDHTSGYESGVGKGTTGTTGAGGKRNRAPSRNSTGGVSEEGLFKALGQTVPAMQAQAIS